MVDPANSNTPAQIFDMREDDEGWTVFDVATGEPARVKGVPQTGLDMDVADDLVDLLTSVAADQREHPVLTDDTPPISRRAIEALRGGPAG